jgi:hypothetical protein
MAIDGYIYVAYGTAVDLKTLGAVDEDEVLSIRMMR